MDFYKGELSGLAVCEVEFDDENQAKEFLPPYFFGKEITGDARYRNRNLALNGLPETKIRIFCDSEKIDGFLGEF